MKSGAYRECHARQRHRRRWKPVWRRRRASSSERPRADAKGSATPRRAGKSGRAHAHAPPAQCRRLRAIARRTRASSRGRCPCPATRSGGSRAPARNKRRKDPSVPGGCLPSPPWPAGPVPSAWCGRRWVGSQEASASQESVIRGALVLRRAAYFISPLPVSPPRCHWPHCPADAAAPRRPVSGRRAPASSGHPCVRL